MSNDHDDGHHGKPEPYPALRARALESLLVEKGLISTDAVDALVQAYEHDIGPLNGELVFEAPWEGRAFGLAVTLVEQGVFDWRDFQHHLVAQIGHVEEASGPHVYYEQWLAALERVALDNGLITAHELDERTDRCASTD